MGITGVENMGRHHIDFTSGRKKGRALSLTFYMSINNSLEDARSHQTH